MTDLAGWSRPLPTSRTADRQTDPGLWAATLCPSLQNVSIDVPRAPCWQPNVGVSYTVLSSSALPYCCAGRYLNETHFCNSIVCLSFFLSVNDEDEVPYSLSSSIARSLSLCLSL